MAHPLQHLTSSSQKRLLLVLTALTLVMVSAFRILDRPLHTPAAPSGIVSFELAGTLPAAQAILASWDRPAQLLAAFGLGLDYLFMPLYSTTIGLACIMAAGGPWRSRRPLAAVGLWLAWGLWLAALLDAAENYALLHVLLGSTGAGWPALARACASGKFLLILAGLVYALVASGVTAAQWSVSRARRAT